MLPDETVRARAREHLCVVRGGRDGRLVVRGRVAAYAAVGYDPRDYMDSDDGRRVGGLIQAEAESLLARAKAMTS